MSWLPHDAGTWVMFLLTLLLTIPMTWVGTATYPTIQKWSIGYSRASLTKRKDKLMREKAEVQDYPLVDLGSDTILEMLYDRIMTVPYATHFVLVIMWYALNRLNMLGDVAHRNGI